MLACDMIVVTVMDVLTTTQEYGSTPVFIVNCCCFCCVSCVVSIECRLYQSVYGYRLSTVHRFTVDTTTNLRRSHLLLHKYLYDCVGIESN